MRLALAGVAVVLTIATAGAVAHERITTTVTWDREISAIIRARCVTCHRDQGRAPMSLATYTQARPWARAIRHEVMTRRMPIWRAARGYGDFANDPSLSPFEISLVTAWVDGGAPKSFVPRGTPVPRVPGPAETPLVPELVTPVTPPADVREVVLPCGDRAAPAGRLVGLRPELRPHTSVRVLAAPPGGPPHILGWFLDFDPDFAPTYWLRTPLALPSGTRLQSGIPVAGTAGRILSSIVPDPCRVVFVFARP